MNMNNKIIIKRWKEDDMEKIGFYDESGGFHMLFGIAKDWMPQHIKVINIQTGQYSEILEGDLD